MSRAGFRLNTWRPTHHAMSAGTARTPRTPAPSLATSETLLDEQRVGPTDDVPQLDVATTGAKATTAAVSTATAKTRKLHLRDDTVSFDDIVSSVAHM